MRAVAQFDIDSFTEEPHGQEEAAVSHGRVRIEKTFRGDLDARSSVQMLATRNEEGAGYVAFEHITGTLPGRAGSFSLLHIGTIDGAEQWARWPVVPGSGSGDLRGIRGEGRIDIDTAGNHTFTLDYELD